MQKGEKDVKGEKGEKGVKGKQPGTNSRRMTQDHAGESQMWRRPCRIDFVLEQGHHERVSTGNSGTAGKASLVSIQPAESAAIRAACFARLQFACREIAEGRAAARRPSRSLKRQTDLYDMTSIQQSFRSIQSKSPSGARLTRPGW